MKRRGFRVIFLREVKVDEFSGKFFEISLLEEKCVGAALRRESLVSLIYLFLKEARSFDFGSGES